MRARHAAQVRAPHSKPGPNARRDASLAGDVVRKAQRDELTSEHGDNFFTGEEFNLPRGHFG